jgi:Secretion system C-terminal sorting domain
MKTTSFLFKATLKQSYYFLIAIASMALYQVADAQTPVTAVFTHLTDATTATSNSGTGATGNASSGLTGNTYTYHFGTNVAATNNNEILDSFTAIGFNYHYQATNMNVQFRRVDNASVVGTRKGFWLQSTAGTVNPGGTASLYQDYDDSLERVFSRQFFNVGIDNVFQNATTTNNNNIERIDVIFPNGVSATDNTKAGFTVFDRGNAGSHDGFYIAAITSLDLSGNPLTYDNAVSVTSANYGSSVGGNVTYLVLRKNPADASLLLQNNISGSQNRDGAFLRFTDLGVANNVKIYGYSIMSTDVVVTPATNMVNYSNAANFPTTTDYGATGGIDPLAVTGLWVTNASFIVLAEKVETFNASLTDSKVQLSWQLGAVDDLMKVVIERSADGTSYSPILSYSNPSQSLQSGSDLQPLPGENYYRLELVNDNGTVASYSQVSAINNAAATGFSFNIYPNPVKNKQFTLNSRGLDNENYCLRLFNMSGKLIFNQELAGGSAMSKEIALPAGLTEGMYSAQLVKKNGNSVFIKMLMID